MVGLVGSSYFFGFAGSAAIFPAIADRWGRKAPYLVALGIQVGVYLTIMLSHSVYLNIAMYVMVGVCAGG